MAQKIVIIDDEKFIRTTTTILLQQKGFEVLGAENGREGISIVKTNVPDIVLLDIMMPQMSGWEVLRILRQDPQTRDVHIIIFTAADLPPPDDIIKEFGYFSTVKKPFTFQQLLQTINDCSATKSSSSRK